MIRALLAALIIVCPAALGQEQTLTLQCSHTHCMVPIPVLEALLERAANCGPTR